MKVLVTGYDGQLGYDVVQQLKNISGMEVQGVDKDDFDITDDDATLKYIHSFGPDVIVHCAAYTAVDKAEEDQELCYKVNVEGTLNIAIAAKEVNAKLVYISTDYVFEGTGDTVYETNYKTKPINYYGMTKWLGEEAVRNNCLDYFIVRISWVFGVNGNNFIKTMLRLAETRDELSVVCDQVGSPTFTEDVAKLICDMIQTDRYGTYHATNEGFCSWYEFAKYIFEVFEIPMKVNPIPSSAYKTLAARPLNSRLSKSSLNEGHFKRLPTWQEAVKAYRNLL